MEPAPSPLGRPGRPVPGQGPLRSGERRPGGFEVEAGIWGGFAARTLRRARFGCPVREAELQLLRPGVRLPPLKVARGPVRPWSPFPGPTVSPGLGLPEQPLTAPDAAVTRAGREILPEHSRSALWKMRFWHWAPTWTVPTFIPFKEFNAQNSPAAGLAGEFWEAAH